MDSDVENKLSICRLCLETSEDVVNVWNAFQDSTIAAVVSKHFWFEIHRSDLLTEWLCKSCWFQIKSFHEFYKQIEFRQERFDESTEQKDICEIDVALGAARSDPVIEPVFNLVKCEGTEVKLETIDSHPSSQESSADETDNISENERKSVNNEREGDDTPFVLRKGGLSPSEKTELEVQIREICNMKCDICSDVQFTTLFKAKQHYRNVHKTEGYITCCGKKFTRPYEVVRHIRSHINPDTKRSVVDGQIREICNMKCKICNDVEFESLIEARQHYRKVHKTQGYIMCCERKFFKRYDVVKHVFNHLNPEAFRCEQCNKCFKSEKTLKDHIDNHVPLDSREFKCSLCPSSFNKVFRLKHHVQQKHTSKTGEKFPCDKCGKNFRSSLLLYCHIRQLHTLAQEYVCEVCARTFKNKHTLQYHFSLEHSSTPPPKVQCDICGVWVRRLDNHRKLHSETKPLNCPICNKESRTKSGLASHIAYVHGEKRFPCTLCDKVLKSSKSLKEHVAVHTGEDLYNCPYCEKKFKSNANMYSHRKNVHLAEWRRDYPQRSTSTKVSAEVTT